MANKSLTIKNLGSREQYIIHNGKRYSINGYSVGIFSAEIAMVFVSKCHPYVIIDREEVDTSVNPEDLVWIYNTTGDPDSPEKIEVIQVTKGKETTIIIANPKHKPIQITRDMDLGQKMGRNKGEETFLNLGKKTIVINPYTRRAFSDGVADWLLTRDSRQSAPMRGALKKSRAPSAFEPNETWSMDDIAIYGKLIDPNLDTGIAEKDLTDPDDLDLAIATLMRRMFFRLADPSFRLLTEEEFLSYKERKYPSKRRGRPRKEEEAPPLPPVEQTANA